MSFSDVNWLAVVLATIASFAFGAVWYMGLSRQWLDALGKTKEQLQVGFTPFAWSILAELVMAYFVALFTRSVFDAVTIGNAVTIAVLLWLGLVITTLIMNHRYEGMKWSLTIIDGLHILGVLIIQGLVIGLLG
jgi:hypothetical protein